MVYFKWQFCPYALWHDAHSDWEVALLMNGFPAWLIRPWNRVV